MDRQQTRVFENLDRFSDRAIIGILELCPTVSPQPPRSATAIVDKGATVDKVATI